jgi:nucleoside-triphosphatase
MSTEVHGARVGATNILLTGRPGVGKTTVIRRLAELLSNRSLAGFYTEEIREGGQREGFGATTLSGGTCVLAHVNHKGRYRVGKYGVDVAAFEQLVLPELTRQADVMLIDEIGKMESFSGQFVGAVRGLLGGPTPVVATVAVSGGGLIAEAKARPDAEVWKVTHDTRDELPQQLALRLTTLSGQ